MNGHLPRNNWDPVTANRQNTIVNQQLHNFYLHFTKSKKRLVLFSHFRSKNQLSLVDVALTALNSDSFGLANIWKSFPSHVYCKLFVILQRSTTDQLVRLVSFERDMFARRKHVVAIFSDLRKTRHGGTAICEICSSWSDVLLAWTQIQFFNQPQSSSRSDPYLQEKDYRRETFCLDMSDNLITTKMNRLWNTFYEWYGVRSA